MLAGDDEDGPALITCPPDRVAINRAPTAYPSSPAGSALGAMMDVNKFTWQARGGRGIETRCALLR